MNAKSVLIVLAAVIMTTVPVNAKLKEGDPAPPIKVTKWVKGAPVTKFVKGQVYVVEFWATWCGPCRDAMPHLTELAKQYKGQVTFAGINVSEQEKGAARVAKVTKFVRDMGDKMGYSVGIDTESRTTGKAWMAAAGQKYIPTSFVVGKNGRLAWIGSPAKLGSVLNPILNGTFNVRAAAVTRVEYDALMAIIAKTYETKNYRGGVEAIDKYLGSHPDKAPELAVNKFMFLLEYDAPAAMDYANRLANGVCKDDADGLNAMAYTALDAKYVLKIADYPIVLSMAERANALKAGKDANCLDTLAAVYAKTGDMAKALATQERAVAKLDKSMPNDEKKTFTDRLAEYKAKAPR